jgi:hypothetical protein
MTDVEKIVEDSGMMIPEIMGEMMEKGYLVTGQQGSVSLMKMPTDSDPKTTINAGADNPSILTGFETKLHAIARYLQIRHEKEPVVPILIEWSGQVRYEIGRNIKFHELSGIMAETYSEAMRLGTEQADAFIEGRPDLKQFGYKEVRVRPA